MYAAKRSVDCQIKKSGWQIVASPPASLTQTLAALLVPLLAVSRARPRGSPPPACTALRDRPALSWVAHLPEGRQPQKSLKGDPLDPIVQRLSDTLRLSWRFSVLKRP